MRNDDCRPDWRAIAFDETRYWNLREEDRPYVARILGVYFYDAREYTYCCELTPSYYLRFLGHEVVTTDDANDDDREALWERYASEPGEDCYMHVRDVTALPSVPYLRPGETVDDDDLTEDAVREYWQGNSPNVDDLRFTGKEGAK
jgi:hypothetical protein